MKYIAQQIESQEDLDEGFVEVELDEEDLLEEIDDELIRDYAISWCNVIDEDSVTTVEGADENELVYALKRYGYNFAREIGEDEMIEELESRGYIISEQCESKYDYIDNVLYDEIFAVFDSLSVFDRQRLRNEIIKFK